MKSGAATETMRTKMMEIAREMNDAQGVVTYEKYLERINRLIDEELAKFRERNFLQFVGIITLAPVNREIRSNAKRQKT